MLENFYLKNANNRYNPKTITTSHLHEFCRCCLTQITNIFYKIYMNLPESNSMDLESELLPIGKQLYLLCPDLDLQFNPKAVLCVNCYQIITTLKMFMCQFNKNIESINKHPAYVFNYDHCMSTFRTAITDGKMKTEKVCLYDNKDSYEEIQDELIYSNNIITKQKLLKCYYSDGNSQKREVIENGHIHFAETTCSSYNQGSEHYNNSKKYNLVNQIREKLFKCLQCDGHGSNKTHFQHQNPIEKKLLKCSQCDYSSHNKANLRRHMYVHSGDKPFKCLLCMYASSDKGNLRTHMRVHTGEKPFKCTLCNYSGCNKAHLRCHMSVHTGIKPFKCSQCNYKSCNKGNLKSHIHVHTSEKPFKCLQCDYCSSNKAHLRRHMYIHTGEKPFKCLQCGFSFSRKDKLKKHISIHVKNRRI